MAAEPMTPPVNAPAPPFSLPSNGGGTVSLADFAGRQHVVLYFYPRDDTTGCTKEACAFRDLKTMFAAAGAVILGVSADDVESHDRFSTKFDLNFPLLADPDHAVCEAYGVWKLRSQAGREWMGIERTTFLIDRAGILRKVYPRVTVDGHADNVLADLKALGSTVS